MVRFYIYISMCGHYREKERESRSEGLAVRLYVISGYICGQTVLVTVSDWS